MGMTAAQRDALVAAGHCTMAKYAFCCNYAPGGRDEQPFLDMVVSVLGAPPTAAVLGLFRRLHFEAFTLAAADLRQRVDRVEDSQPRKLAAPERSFRYTAQALRLTGLNLTNELEPSDALVDLACQQYEDNRMAWIEWDCCTKKSQELRGIKKIPQLKSDLTGVIKLANTEQSLQADLDTELLIRFALQRRGLALDQAGLVTFGIHDSWVDMLFFHRMQIPPTGYAKVSVAQLINADRALHTKMAELTRQGVVPDAFGVRPMDVAIATAMAHSSVTFLLMPLPGLQVSNKRPATSLEFDDKDKEKGKGKGNKRTKTKGKGKGKAKGKGSEGEPRGGMPSDLAGMSARDPAGNMICFNFNRGSCTNTVTNNKCQRGVHVCCKPGCGGPHPMGGCNR